MATTPESAASALKLEQTRRQLQELDSLLKQMLALPITTGAESSPVGIEGDEPSPHADSKNSVVPDPPTIHFDSATGRRFRLDGPAKSEPPDESVPKRLVALEGPGLAPVEGQTTPGNLKAPRPIFTPVTARVPLPEAGAEGTPPPEDSASSVDAGRSAISSKETLPNPAASPSLVPRRPTPVRDVYEFDLTGPTSMDVGNDMDAGTVHVGMIEPIPAMHTGQTKSRPATVAGSRASSEAGGAITPSGVMGSSRVRNFLGWFGVTLLVTALAISLGAWMGWNW